jgi:predicted ATP-grasp superfamily ATP-dependent carboligase
VRRQNVPGLLRRIPVDRAMTRVIIAGVSTRAAAESAARAGFDVTALDGFADRDQHPFVRSLSLSRDVGVAFTARAAAAAADTIGADAVAYLSNFENDPEAVAMLAAGRRLWGNPPEVLRRCRDPFRVAAIFRAHGLPTPHIASANDLNDSNDSNDSDDSHAWLVKPRSSGGGHGIRAWRPGTEVRRWQYAQQRIDGVPGSIVFVAAAGRVAVLGVSRQLIGDARFGAGGYRYCGSILAPVSDPQFTAGEDLVRSARTLADVAAADLSLVGVNGIDFVARRGVAYAVEINPRWSASMELVERASGRSLFAAHAAACDRLDPGTDIAAPARALERLSSSRVTGS